MYALSRIARMVAAYLAASFAAGCILAAAIGISTQGVEPLELATLPYRGVMAGTIVAVFAALPAAVAIIYGESHGYRSLRFYAGAGAATGAISALGWPLLLSGASPRGLQWPSAEGAAALGIWIVTLAVAGLVGGLAYWALAGRSAGTRSGPAAASGVGSLPQR
jgi:hypothetical protein